MRSRFLALLCVWAPAAGADIGIGAAVGDDDATILLPIRLTSILVEPQFGYSSSDFEAEMDAPESTEGQTIGVGLFGLKATGENLSIYYGARLAQHTEESDSPILDIGTGLPIGSTETEVDGYSVTPLVGLQYSIDSIMIGAELGWVYRDVDVEVAGSIGTFTIMTTASQVSRGTTASVVFRYFFGQD